MVTIRLSRVGRKNAPSYRLVAQDKRKDPWGKSIEILGHFNPRTNPREIVFKTDRIKHWLSQGAEMSDTVWNLFVDEKLVEGKKRSVTHISKERAAKMADEKAKEEKKEAPAA
ncbi:30S ribosomal protein S16 [Candidatus Uhrbacteria bacterium RIFCSPHIGHO2_01_FULL_63_20]|uniref:Small ribosomal subunit protein bS16 n=1 Tax=Candidatus Uhrbacteria bacterium RIFCSPHIGHO2_01_FULL_63_20 TaxID=1802385 RepID=A0A1F7TJX6_9BACT|nr:MAG: 30S ribosomal protein S16 [Candidatus Uhrbacteria bacterium RIFCSPHIGHO2_01_FULL_63_20]